MSIPHKIKVNREEELHSNYIGHTADGRKFWGYLTFVFTKTRNECKGEDWLDYRREYAIMHTFDRKGLHLTTQHWFGGMAKLASDVAMENKIQEWIKDLGKVKFGDVEIQLFQTEIDGFIFGLIGDEATETVNLQPSSLISFMAPWDGEYYT